MYLIKSNILFIILLILSACSTDNNNAECDILNIDSLKYGIVYNGCGPTDLPIVRIILTDEEFSCEDMHRNVKHISSYLEITSVEDIKVGMVISGHSYNFDGEPVSAFECEKDFENCIEVGVISIEILCDNENMLQGKWKLDGNDRSGNFYIKKCNEERGICG